MVDLSRQHGSLRPLLLRGAVLFSSGALVFLLGSSVPKSEQRPLGPFGGLGSPLGKPPDPIQQYSCGSAIVFIVFEDALSD